MRAQLLIAGLLLGGSVQAASLQDQINAVHQAELQQQAVRQAEADRARREYEAALAKAEQQRTDHQRRAEAARLEQQRAANARAAQVRADQQARNTERLADKQRDQGFEDELRQLEIEERKLKVAQMKARTERTNDFIDQELRQQSALTDVVQSNADANRNLSEGGKALMQSEGVAREKDASRWFK